MDKYFLSFLRYVGGPSVIMLSAYAMIKFMNKKDPGEIIESEVGGFIYGKDCFGNDLRIKKEDEVPIITILGASRSKKTTTAIIPNILDKEYGEGQVIFDLKKDELSETLVKPLNEQGWITPVVNIRHSKESVKMNPFEIYRTIDSGVEKLITIFLTITNAISKVSLDINGNDNSEWENLSQDLLKSFIYHLCEELPKNPMKVLVDMVGYPKEELDEILLNSPSKRAQKAYKRLLSCVTNAKDKKGAKVESAGLFNSIRATIAAKLSIFDNDAIFELTSKTTFDPRWVVTGVPRRVEIKDMCGEDCDTSNLIRSKVALFYSCDSSSKSHVYSGVTLLFAHMIYDAMEDEKIKRRDVGDEEALKRRVRIYMDEFLTLGKMWQFANKINTCGSYKFSFIVSIQNYKYFENLYQEDVADTIVTNGPIIALNDTDPDCVDKLFIKYSPIDKYGNKKYLESTLINEGNCVIRCKKKYFQIVKMHDPIFLTHAPVHYIELVDSQAEELYKCRGKIKELLDEMRKRDVREKAALDAISMLNNKVKELKDAGKKIEIYEKELEIAKKKIEAWEQYSDKAVEAFDKYNDYMKMAREYYTEKEKRSGNNIYRRVNTPNKPKFDEEGNVKITDKRDGSTSKQDKNKGNKNKGNKNKHIDNNDEIINNEISA